MPMFESAHVGLVARNRPLDARKGCIDAFDQRLYRAINHALWLT